MKREEMTTEEWAQFAKFAKELHAAPENSKREIYFVSEGVRMVAERENAA